MPPGLGLVLRLCNPELPVRLQEAAADVVCTIACVEGTRPALSQQVRPRSDNVFSKRGARVGSQLLLARWSIIAVWIACRLDEFNVCAGCCGETGSAACHAQSRRAVRTGAKKHFN